VILQKISLSLPRTDLRSGGGVDKVEFFDQKEYVDTVNAKTKIKIYY
jgi:hypothetical protein